MKGNDVPELVRDVTGAETSGRIPDRQRPGVVAHRVAPIFTGGQGFNEESQVKRCGSGKGHAIQGVNQGERDWAYGERIQRIG